jgi:hypothetical protein
MFGRARRPITALSMVALAFDVVSCHHVVQREADTGLRTGVDNSVTEQLVGLTLRDGREVRFSNPSTVLRNDSLFAYVGGLPYAVAMADVQRVWLRKIDPTRTTLAVIGAAAGVVAVGMAIIVATKESCPFVYSWDGTRYVFDAEP